MPVSSGITIRKFLSSSRLEKLKTVTFQRDLGSYFSKTESNLLMAKAVAAAVAAQAIPLDHAALEQAVLLAKTDLTTELVKEFTELQGIVGGLYARAQGLGETVAQAIYSQYMPASTGRSHSRQRWKGRSSAWRTGWQPLRRCSPSASSPADPKTLLRCAAPPMG